MATIHEDGTKTSQLVDKRILERTVTELLAVAVTENQFADFGFRFGLVVAFVSPSKKFHRQIFGCGFRFGLIVAFVVAFVISQKFPPKKFPKIYWLRISFLPDCRLHRPRCRLRYFEKIPPTKFFWVADFVFA